ncbi:MAG: long-chain-fatty-acid--CoA ligase [Pseudomonadota bacterium]|nr:long-chain-fatty-acid--CoA ligase [Pseudomonadota bacterium]
MQATQILRQAYLDAPDRPATVFGDRVRTWREVYDRVARLAGALKTLGVGAGDCIAAIGTNSDRYVEIFYAIPWAGAAFTPLNIRWAVAENRFAMGDSKARILFVDDQFLDHGRALAEGNDVTMIYMGEGATPDGMLNYETLIEQSDPMPDADRKGDDLYVVLYTSGTTSQSKGVALSHRNAMTTSICFLATLPQREDLTHVHVGGLFHLAGAGPCWYITLAAGTHVILPKFEAEPVLEAIHTHKATNIVMVPTMINMLLNHPRLKDYDLSSIRTCVYGGSPMPEAVLQNAFRELPTWGFHQIYGMTETTGYGVAFRASDHVEALANNPERLKAAGRVVPGLQIKVVRPDGETAAIGETGEVLLRGDNVMTSYLHNPQATAETLVDGWLRSGDAGYFDEAGYLYIADRIKDMIVTGGENVYSVDVERALYQHAAVREAAVIGIPSERWGESVHAVVVLKDGKSATEEDLIAHCRGLIGGYKVPRSIEFRDEDLPVTPVGKIRKNVLRDPYWDGQSRKIS